MAVLGAGAPGADLGQAGVALDLDAPALVVGEVEVEDVQLVGGQQVQVAQDVVLGQEVPGDVEHHAAPAEAGFVLDDDRRNLPGAARGERGAPEDVRAEELAEGLRAPEDAGRGAARDAYGVRLDGQAVALGGERLVEGEHDAPPVGAGARTVAGAGAGAVALGKGSPVAGPSVARSQRATPWVPGPAVSGWCSRAGTVRRRPRPGCAGPGPDRGPRGPRRPRRGGSRVS